MPGLQPGLFRKRPVTIEAIRFDGTPPDGTNAEQILDWMHRYGWTSTQLVEHEDDSVTIEIHTLEGVMEASLGDWIIHGVQGEFYPCKPDIFEQTYEIADVVRRTG